MLPSTHLPIQEAAAKFDWSCISDLLAKATDERREVVDQFPRESWGSLPLERYALGQENRSRGTFCWWLEYATKNIGRMGGRAAAHLLIYKRLKQADWYFDQGQFPDEQAAWQAIRAGIVEALEKAQAGQWDLIDSITALQGATALRLKTLFIYFPNDLLPITAPDHLRHYLRLLCPTEEEDKNLGAVQLNRKLLVALREVLALRERSTQEMEKFLYRWADPRENRLVVKISPGHDAMYWSDCEREGMICVGWDRVGDLLAYENRAAYKEAFLTAYADEYTTTQKAGTKANELWTLRELEPGDIVIANQGTTRVLAVGEVVRPGYEWREDREEFKHTVHVDWDTSYACNIEVQGYWALATVVKVATDLYNTIMRRTPHNPEQIPVVIPPVYSELADTLERKKQAVLYGPPGTGKTYTARRFAAWWLLRQMNDHVGAGAALSDFTGLISAEEKVAVSAAGARRVWWVVANPKQWAWETLLTEKTVAYRYGRMQRNYPLVQPGDLVVGYQATPDKRVVALAKIKRGLHTAPNGEPQIELESVASVKDGPTYDELLADPQLNTSEPMRMRNQGTLFALTTQEADDLLELLIKRDPSLVVHLHAGLPTGRLTRLTFHGSYSYEDFIEGFRPVPRGVEGLTLQLTDGVFKQVCRQAQLRPDEPFLVLIDEINRANVAKVFGEIITLLEGDKRGMIITLPQSREPFEVPPNVYLLGTMNTADRSIKLLDSALRRRFAFLELMPDASLLHGGQIGPLDLEIFLTELNRRIAAHTDREKQIGHSFLLESGAPVADPLEFCRRFRQEILPLLQEYSYEDYASLAAYLGDELVDKEAQSLNTELLRDPVQLPAKLAALYTQPTGGEK